MCFSGIPLSPRARSAQCQAGVTSRARAAVFLTNWERFISCSPPVSNLSFCFYFQVSVTVLHDNICARMLKGYPWDRCSYQTTNKTKFIACNKNQPKPFQLRQNHDLCRRRRQGCLPGASHFTTIITTLLPCKCMIITTTRLTVAPHWCVDVIGS